MHVGLCHAEIKFNTPSRPKFQNQAFQLHQCLCRFMWCSRPTGNYYGDANFVSHSQVTPILPRRTNYWKRIIIYFIGVTPSYHARSIKIGMFDTDRQRNYKMAALAQTGKRWQVYSIKCIFLGAGCVDILQFKPGNEDFAHSALWIRWSENTSKLLTQQFVCKMEEPELHVRSNTVELLAESTLFCNRPVVIL